MVHNIRTIQEIVISSEGDGAFAVVDVDTLWHSKNNGNDFHWKGRACKVYTKVNDQWKMIYQVGLLDYSDSYSYRKDRKMANGQKYPYLLRVF